MKSYVMEAVGRMIFGLALGVGAGSALAASNLLSTADTAFVTEAAQGGLAEVALGGIAAERAQNERVRDFGELMVRDHSEANEKLIALAKSKGFEVPKSLSAEAEQLRHQLQTMQQDDFDEKYVDEMVKDHRKDVEAFERHAKEADDPDLRRFAEQTLPTLRSHYDAIRDLEDTL